MFKTNIKGALDRLPVIKEKEKCMHLKTVVEPKFCLKGRFVLVNRITIMQYKVKNSFGVEGNS